MLIMLEKSLVFSATQHYHCQYKQKWLKRDGKK